MPVADSKKPPLAKIFKKYMKVKDPDKAHAKLSASGSERWLHCPGSVELSEKAPASQDSEWSIAGTHAHTLLEFLLTESESLLSRPEAKEFKKFIGYSPEQHTAVQVAIDFVKAEKLRMFKETGVWPTLLVEQKVELEGVGFGTSDIILFQPFGVLHVMDYKNGQSAVEPENNTQGLYYAHAAADLYGWDFSEVWITIIQPNAAHKRGPIRTWKTTIKNLEKAGKRFRMGARATKKPNAELVMDSKWCWFCPAKFICPKQLGKAQVKIMDRFQKPSVSDNKKVMEMFSHGKKETGKEKANKETRKEKAGRPWIKAQDFCDEF